MCGAHPLYSLVVCVFWCQKANNIKRCSCILCIQCELLLLIFDPVWRHFVCCKVLLGAVFSFLVYLYNHCAVQYVDAYLVLLVSNPFFLCYAAYQRFRGVTCDIFWCIHPRFFIRVEGHSNVMPVHCRNYTRLEHTLCRVGNMVLDFKHIHHINSFDAVFHKKQVAAFFVCCQLIA